ncbi:BREX-1 system adenine-specific DNA-methyltransferase PglX [Massilia glaciei]|uniref:BREX-1 system adenine-specific DNA-methyltransferase PglX n=1 Tax=Massilia glaciei TaxID=1524097 RepID=UPI001E5CBD52|nr:BREX-1 system adenine-specific DNA-methyltransferase PglX [Massilia glaciei]
MNVPLAKALRTQLENTVKTARDIAEKAAIAALAQLAVGEAKLPEYLSDAQKVLRRRLRAHGRALGDVKNADDSQPTRHLVWEVAYEQWHRMLFARFLAENGLLMWEPGAAVSLDDCRDMVDNHPDMAQGAKSHWELAAKLAARMLPQVFKPLSPVFELVFAPEHQRELEKLLANLPIEVFQASDSLGWVYQFWQAKRKDEVNASEVKIGADELPAVTQLFTEPYMVDFLLHNSLGAWWVTRHPEQACPVPLTYLRTLEDGTPAAGKFEGWPQDPQKGLTEFKLLDPSCGSGHFLVSAFLLLVPMRMAAEGLSAMDAVDAVLADNLHGLELDARCVEIAVFALALAAWRFPDEDGQQLGVRADMPSPKIACCGLKVTGKAADWEALVPADAPHAEMLRQELRHLHASFQQAPILGSLLSPKRGMSGNLGLFEFEGLDDLLNQALSAEAPPTLRGGEHDVNDEQWDLTLAARGLLDAAALLNERYQLVITNVPYLARGKQNDELKEFCELHYPDAKNDLANVFLERCLELAEDGGQGVVQIVMPQNWLFLTSYRKQRESLLKRVQWNFLARLGEGGFDSSQAAGAFIILLTQTRAAAAEDFQLCGLDASPPKSALEKAALLRGGAEVVSVSQIGQLKNPDARVALELIESSGLLIERTSSIEGLSTGDGPRFVTHFWEVLWRDGNWEPFIQNVEQIRLYGGRSDVIRWEQGSGALHTFPAAHNFPSTVMNGRPILGQKGVRVTQMRELACTLYTGEIFGKSGATVVPHRLEDLSAIWCFMTSPNYLPAVRKVDQKINVTNATLIKIYFDLAYWQGIAAERYPNGLPKPYSDDPTQWLFHGHPQIATDTLQVAVARLLGYRWPAESDADMELSDEARSWIARCEALSSHVDDDGIACLSPVRGEQAAHDRLLSLLIAAWETVQPGSWKPAILAKLLLEADCAGKGLDVWLREKFFEQHAKRFQHRPFIWHVWDGLKDGFGALVNYHKLDTKNLERLIHTYLGDWIRQQDDGVREQVDGAEIRLNAALDLKRRLELILEGEKGHDIFVRWKSLAEQSSGWNPDLNDGVRLNIRPFMQAEVLRHNKKPKLNITWDKDRGKDVGSAPWFKVDGGERINDRHLTLAEKTAAPGKR